MLPPSRVASLVIVENFQYSAGAFSGPIYSLVKSSTAILPGIEIFQMGAGCLTKSYFVP